MDGRDGGGDMDHGVGGNAVRDSVEHERSDSVSGLALWAALTVAAMAGAVLGIMVMALVSAGRR